jgi:hypothetical protein
MYQPSPGTLWRIWLRHCAVSQKVEGSISNGIIWIYLHDHSGSTMALELSLLKKWVPGLSPGGGG